MNNTFSIDTYAAGSLSLSTSSPNNLYDYILKDEVEETDVFNLGHWTTDGTNATGYEGSFAIVDVYLKDIYFNNITTGDLNYTIFNPNGEIIPLKISLDDNLTYVDNTTYSLTTASQISPGLYQLNTSFDPSVYGSDEAGSWTVILYWMNGTEVGFVSKTISVTIGTDAEFEWEVTPGSDTWTSDNSTHISRMNGESVKVRASYYSRSEPYFSGLGVPISTANVSYATGWLDSGFLNYITSYYEATIPIDAVADVYQVDMEAYGELMATYEIQFSVLVLHQFGIELDQTDYYLNFSNDIDISFSVLDYTNGSAPVIPDTVDLKVNSMDVTSSDYSYSVQNDKLELNLETLDIDLVPGSYDLEISVSKENFIESFSQVNATETVVLHIQSIITQVQLVAFPTSIYHNNQTTISFAYIDTNHSALISGATFSLSSDISEMEIVTAVEEEGLYTVVIKITEPTASVMNVFLTISKEGYEGKSNILLTTLNILEVSVPTTPEINGEFPTALVVALSVVFGVLALSAAFFFLFARRKLTIFTKKQVASKSRDIFQSVMMLKKVLVVHQETSLPVFDLNLVDDIDFDPSMVSGVLNAISTIGMEMVGAPTGMKKIEYYGFVVTSGYSGAYTIYVFSETELVPELVEGISNTARWFDVIFGYEGAEWDGSMQIFQDYKDQIKERVVDDLYIWLLYPLEVQAEISESMNNLTSSERRIIETIKEKEKLNLVLLLNELKELKREEIISSVIKLVKEEKIIRNIHE